MVSLTICLLFAVERQVPFNILLQEIGGEKNGPRSGGMGALQGPGQGQGLHMPIALRPPSSMQVSGMGKSTMEGGSSASPHGMMPTATRMDLSMSGAPAQGNEMPVKRKRGRPRKYATVDSMAAPAANSGTTESLFSALAKKIAAPYPPPGSADKSEKRGRGRPIGSTKKQQLANLGENLGHILNGAIFICFFCLHCVISQSAVLWTDLLFTLICIWVDI